VIVSPFLEHQRGRRSIRETGVLATQIMILTNSNTIPHLIINSQRNVVICATTPVPMDPSLNEVLRATAFFPSALLSREINCFYH